VDKFIKRFHTNNNLGVTEKGLLKALYVILFKKYNIVNILSKKSKKSKLYSLYSDSEDKIKINYNFNNKTLNEDIIDYCEKKIKEWITLNQNQKKKLIITKRTQKTPHTQYLEKMEIVTDANKLIIKEKPLLNLKFLISYENGVYHCKCGKIYLQSEEKLIFKHIEKCIILNAHLIGNETIPDERGYYHCYCRREFLNRNSLVKHFKRCGEFNAKTQDISIEKIVLQGIEIQDNRSLEELKEFVEKKMRMSHIYQPYIIKTLLENNGTCDIKQIAELLSKKLKKSKNYYVQRILRAPKNVLMKHKIANFGNNNIIKLCFNLFNENLLQEIINICEVKIQDYLDRENSGDNKLSSITELDQINIKFDFSPFENFKHTLALTCFLIDKWYNISRVQGIKKYYSMDYWLNFYKHFNLEYNLIESEKSHRLQIMNLFTGKLVKSDSISYNRQLRQFG
ncbi:hypothetical protein LCGC14_2640880, partial [marine sediment metagenome]